MHAAALMPLSVSCIALFGRGGVDGTVVTVAEMTLVLVAVLQAVQARC